MKTYTITVNGKAYAVTVEEGAAAAGAVFPGDGRAWLRPGIDRRSGRAERQQGGIRWRFWNVKI